MVRGALSTSFCALLFCLSAEIGVSTPPVSKEVENKINKVTKKKGSLSNLFPIKSAKSTSRGNSRMRRAHLTDGHDDDEPAYWTTGEETCVNSDACPIGIGLDDIFSPNEWEDCDSIAHLNLRQVHGVELTGIWGKLDEATHSAHLVVKLDYHDIQEPENVFLVGKWFCKRCMKEEGIPQKFRLGQGEFPLYHFEYHPGQSEGYYQISAHLGEEYFYMVQEGFFDGFRVKVKKGKQDMRLCKYFVEGHENYGERPMTFMQCESYCSNIGATVACVTDDAQDAQLTEKQLASSCSDVWVGYNDHDYDGSWRWPDGCSSSRVYGECGDSAPCDGYETDQSPSGMCVTNSRDVAWCDEIFCCACSYSERVLHIYSDSNCQSEIGANGIRQCPSLSTFRGSGGSEDNCMNLQFDTCHTLTDGCRSHMSQIFEHWHEYGDGGHGESLGSIMVSGQCHLHQLLVEH